MTNSADINEYIAALKASERMGEQVAFHTILPGCPPDFAEPDMPWPDSIREILTASGISRLYSHQVAAINHIRAGRHVVTATPTASGKSMIYNLPVLEQIHKNPAARALYLFPLKALAQDQFRTFETMGCHAPFLNPTAAIYDGDTPDGNRKRIRGNPPNVLFTNPEMLHLSLLPYHRSWAAFFSGLKAVIVDEVHTYRGVMGSHMAQVFRRFRRICEFYGASPIFIFSSATVGNPAELAARLTGLDVELVQKSGAPQSKKHIVFMDPAAGPAQTAILLLKAALHRRMRTIVYAQSRKMTELIALWAGSRAGAFAGRISAYRAGFLPEERRDIEAKLSSGELLAVISTSALELGIDVGDLDLCLLVGYPGTIVATWQRAGRVGRSGQDAAAILVGGEDALDQYFLNNPLELISRSPEDAVVNPYNPEILRRHMICAAAELPFSTNEPFLVPQPVQQALRHLEQTGDLLRSGDGEETHARRKSPHREVDLRGSGSRYSIFSALTGKHIGDIDGFRAFRETHPGAVYLHNGETMVVETLDTATQTVKITPGRVDYYTRVRADKDTEILEILDERRAWGVRVFAGRLRVTDQVTGYEKWRIHGRKKINILPLDLPPQIFETEGLWFEIPRDVQKKAEAEFFHFMGGIHALEHAAIGIFPLLVMSDRNDLGGISTPFHPQAGSAAVFIYDSVPGGAGITRQAFRKAGSLLETTLKAIEKCPCEFGCPSCVHSPKCGSGNRPIDKNAAIFILNAMREHSPAHAEPVWPKIPVSPPPSVAEPALSLFEDAMNTKSHDIPTSFGVLDVETRRSAEEVGGWHHADRMGISCVVVYDSQTGEFHEYLQEDMAQMTERLKGLDLIIGFNIRRFDYAVLGGQSDFDFKSLPTLDILDEVKKRLGYRLSLDHLARTTLGTQKSADGLQALKWWKQGKIRQIIDYCRMDVEVTRDLYLYGMKNRYLLFTNKAGNIVRLPVSW